MRELTSSTPADATTRTSWSRSSPELQSVRQSFVVGRGVDVDRVGQVAGDRQSRDKLRPGPDHGAAADIAFQRQEIAPQLALEHDRRMEKPVEAERRGRQA